MSEGLGLNHFADGLPYTPASTKRANATSHKPSAAALAAAAATKLAQAPVGTDTARRMIQQFDAETSNAPVSPTTDYRGAERAVSAHSDSNDPAGFIRRTLAYAIDVACASGMFALIVWAAFSLNGYNIQQLLSERRGVQLLWPLTLLYGVVYMGYFLIQETTWRRTIGKALVGIRIRSASGFATLGRAVCFFIAAIPLGVGLCWYFFDQRKRCWHDVITDSEVVLS